MRSRNSTLCVGHKWKNVSVSEMIRFLGILLQISLELRKMGVYTSCFAVNSNVQLGTACFIELRGNNEWAKDTITLARFK